MKKLICLCFIFLLAFILSADDSYVLRIRAFKPGDQDVVLKLNNALTLDDISNGDIVNLNDSASEIVGSIPSSAPSSMISKVIFSYRVEGADPPETGNSVGYKLTMTLSPFKLFTGSDSTEQDVIIPAYYQLGNLNVTFPGTTEDANSPDLDEWHIEYTDETSYIQNGLADTTNVSFETAWNVSQQEGTRNPMPKWVARGAVGVIIDYRKYSDMATPYGKYRATATLRLEVK